MYNTQHSYEKNRNSRLRPRRFYRHQIPEISVINFEKKLNKTEECKLSNSKWKKKLKMYDKTKLGDKPSK